WLHGEFLLVEGAKMSKSKGNFYTLRDLLDRGYEPLAIRLELLRVPYRKQLNFTLEGLKGAQSSLERIKDFLFRLNEATLPAGSNMSDAIRAGRDQFEAALDDDLNTAQALAAMFELVRQANIAISEGKLGEDDRKGIREFFAVLDDRLAIVPS